MATRLAAGREEGAQSLAQGTKSTYFERPLPRLSLGQLLLQRAEVLATRAVKIGVSCDHKRPATSAWSLASFGGQGHGKL